jgi:hypothetical protein
VLEAEEEELDVEEAREVVLLDTELKDPEADDKTEPETEAEPEAEAEAATAEALIDAEATSEVCALALLSAKREKTTARAKFIVNMSKECENLRDAKKIR